MTLIKPFRALRYNTDLVQMDRVVAPPYDIISPKEQNALYERDPHNIIRIEYGKDEGGDQYAKAAEYLNQWMKQGLLRSDSKESFYLYETSFKDPENNREKRRLVIFGIFHLESFESKIILPHEKTHLGPKEDRFKLLSAVRTNISPVYGLYRDEKKIARDLRKRLEKFEKQKSLYEFKLSGGETHKLWAISDSADIERISKMFSNKQILIADGHHRYETALRYSREHPSPASKFCLMGLVELEDEGLIIFPIHRLLKNIRNTNPGKLAKMLSPLFESKKISDDELKQISQGKIRKMFATCFPNESLCFKLKDMKEARKQMPAGKPDIWYQLEVAQISHLVLKHFGVDDKNLERHLEYTRFFDEAIQAVRSKRSAAAVIVPPIEARTMQAVCVSGELMPQKSTYFYPKLGSGFLMYRYE